MCALQYSEQRNGQRKLHLGDFAFIYVTFPCSTIMYDSIKLWCWTAQYNQQKLQSLDVRAIWLHPSDHQGGLFWLLWLPGWMFVCFLPFAPHASTPPEAACSRLPKEDGIMGQGTQGAVLPCQALQTSSQKLQCGIDKVH